MYESTHNVPTTETEPLTGVYVTYVSQILMTTEPLWAAVFGSLLMGESLGVSACVGGGLILAACLVNLIEDSQIEEWKRTLGLGSLET